MTTDMESKPSFSRRSITGRSGVMVAVVWWQSDIELTARAPAAGGRRPTSAVCDLPSLGVTGVKPRGRSRQQPRLTEGLPAAAVAETQMAAAEAGRFAELPTQPARTKIGPQSAKR